MVTNCRAFKGRITQEDVICVFRASEHAPPDSLRDIYIQIETIADDALYMELEHSKEDDPNNGNYIRKETLDDLKKGMLLSMQGDGSRGLLQAGPSQTVPAPTMR